MQRQVKAFSIVALPLAVVLAALDTRVSAREQQVVTDQPMVSRSGVDLAAMDKSASPCTDFYQFACGGWVAKHPAPPDQPHYARFSELQDRNKEILHDILQHAMEPGVTDPDMKKIGDYFASCMSEKAIDTIGTEPLEADLKRVDAIKAKTDIPPVVGHFQTVGTTSFF